ncbi:MAG TPA: glycosyltransferase [Hyphomicrobium sp.]|jgi:glycosyltransferase involved in cell wall biosynthesis
MSQQAKGGVLYVTYDGLLEPLGQSQVLAYLEKLAPQWPIHVLSFEKPKDIDDGPRMDAMRQRLAKTGIGWTPLRYHKSPTIPATGFDILQGACCALWLGLRRKVAIVHARSYVAALIALPVKRLLGAKLLFDIRGFWADERVDGGLWPKDGGLYRAVKKLEGAFVASADHMVTLTHSSVRELQKWPAFAKLQPPLSVIPTCADLERFSPGPAPAREPLVFGYVGSLGTWYLFDETIEFFLALRRRRPDAKMLVVNRNEHEPARQAFARHGIEADHFEIVAVEHFEVPRQIARMHTAGAVIKPSYSKISSAPTKLAEYLGCGVPCVGNVGVGDMEEVLEGRRVGVALRDFSPADIESAADRLLALLEEPALRHRCSAVAHELFSLDIGVARYRSIYGELSDAMGSTQASDVSNEGKGSR